MNSVSKFKSVSLDSDFTPKWFVMLLLFSINPFTAFSNLNWFFYILYLIPVKRALFSVCKVSRVCLKNQDSLWSTGYKYKWCFKLLSIEQIHICYSRLRNFFLLFFYRLGAVRFNDKTEANIWLVYWMQLTTEPCKCTRVYTMEQFR